MGTSGYKSNTSESSGKQDLYSDKLMNEKDFIQNLVGNLSGFVYRCNNDKDWTMLHIEGPFKSLTGYNKYDVISNHKISFASLIHEDDREYVTKNVNDALEKSSRFTIEYRIITRDGSVKWVWERGVGVYRDGEIKYIDGIMEDITQKYSAEAQIKLLSRSVEQSPVSVVITDKDGVIEYVNNAFTNVTGFGKKEAIGQTPAILKSGHQGQQFYQEMWETLLRGEEWSGEILNKRKDGTTLWEEVMVSPIKNDKGDITHFVGVKEDITEKKQMIDDLVDAKDKAEESDRLKSSFLANMSHEIRTPMNGILGFLDVLQNEDLSDAQRKHYLSIVREGGNRLLSTINDIIEISRLEAGQVTLNETSIDVNDLLLYFRDFYSNEVAKKDVTFEISNQVKAKSNIIVTDKTKLESILTNFVKNAIKFTSKGFIEIGVYSPPGKIVFYVKDSGIGIPEKRKKAIFDRFVQADLDITKPHEGSGLGLSIARGYAQLLGGNVWLESEEDKGSTFFFSLPFKTALEQPKKVPEKENGHDVITGGKNKLVLVAEDEENSYLFLKIVLTNHNYRVLWARNGSEAIKYCQENHDISYILMDMKMPVMDGYAATRKIREFNPDIPIIAQTAYALSGDRQKALEAGCNNYIHKPIKKDKLLKLLENI